MNNLLANNSHLISNLIDKGKNLKMSLTNCRYIFLKAFNWMQTVLQQVKSRVTGPL